VERETGFEPATFSLKGFGLEGPSVYAKWHPWWRGEHFVSSYRVVVWRGRQVLRAFRRLDLAERREAQFMPPPQTFERWPSE
jgi:hypothetical protein